MGTPSESTRTIFRIASGVIERGERKYDEKALRDTFVVEGYASTRDPDLDEYVIEPEAFADGMAAFKRNPVLLFNHDRDRVLGRVVNPRIDDRGLKIEAEFDLEDEFAAAKAGQVERGFLRGFSVGFRTLDDPKPVDGKLYFRKVQLLEISLVTIPANPHALIGASADAELLTRVLKLEEARRAAPTSQLSTREIVAAVTAQLSGELEYVVAAQIERRLGSVRDITERCLDARGVEDADRLIDDMLGRLKDIPSGEAGPGGGGPAGGGASPPAGVPPFSPPSKAGKEQPDPSAKPGTKVITGLPGVPAVTSPDSADGHRHKLLVIRDDGSGETETADGKMFLPHSHKISNFLVIPINVAGKESYHFGTLYPGEQL